MLELYRKYRPKTFDDIVGNDVAIKTAKKSLKNGSQVFLFVGGAGCGKTTLARIMARYLGASDVTIKEINTANNNGIDTARDVMEQMQYTSIDGAPLVWIIDECHQMTTAAQNAFLKALEDTPKGVYFFLCTTDPQKLISTLKTRCSVITLKPLKDEDMISLLHSISNKEKVKMSVSILERISDIAKGCARLALKLLGSVLGLDTDKERLEYLKSAVTEDDENALALSRCLIRKNVTWGTITEVLNKIDLSAPENVRRGVMGYMNAVLMKGYNPIAAAAMQAFGANASYNNGKFTITIACLDFMDMIQGG